MRQLVLALAGAALCTGCASLAQQTGAQHDVTCHYAHMASQEKLARAAGVSLRWVNCPLIPNNPTPEGTPVRVAATSR
jgi:uncharacterized protein YceK